MIEDAFTARQFADDNIPEEDAENYFRKRLFMDGYSTSEINDYFGKADNALRSVYGADPRYQHLRKVQPASSPGVLKYLQYGFQNSALGLWMRDSMPDAVTMEQAQKAGFLGRLAMGIGGMAGDAPAFIPAAVGTAVTGGAAAPVIGALSFSALEGYKAARMHDLMKGAGYDVGDKVDEMTRAAIQGGIIGLVLPGAGSLGFKAAAKAGMKAGLVKDPILNSAGKMVGAKVGAGYLTAGRMAGETAWMGTAGPIMEGRMPELQDYVDNAAVMIGWHGVNAAGSAMLRKVGVPNLIHGQMRTIEETVMDLSGLSRDLQEHPEHLSSLLSRGELAPDVQKKAKNLANAHVMLEAYSEGAIGGEGVRGISREGMVLGLTSDQVNNGIIRIDILPEADQAILRAQGLTEIVRTPTGTRTEVVSLKGVDALHAEVERRVSEAMKIERPQSTAERIQQEKPAGQEGIVEVSGERGKGQELTATELRRRADEARFKAENREGSPSGALDSGISPVPGQGEYLSGERAEGYAGFSENRKAANDANLERQSQELAARAVAAERNAVSAEREVEYDERMGELKDVREAQDAAMQENKPRNASEVNSTDQVYQAEQERAANKESLRQALLDERGRQERVHNLLEAERLAEPIVERWVADGMNREEAQTAATVFARSAMEMSKVWDMTPEEYISKNLPRIRTGETSATGERGSYLDRIISLFKGSDNTTIYHEMSHFWLEQLMDARAAGRGGLAERLVSRLMNEYGLDFDELNFKGGKYNEAKYRDFQERFAKDFEAFLRDGKLAAPEMRDVFTRIRDWFRAVYESVRSILGEGSPRRAELDSFFNEMLFGEREARDFTYGEQTLFNQAIEAARAKRGVMREQINVGRGKAASPAGPEQRGRGGNKSQDNTTFLREQYQSEYGDKWQGHYDLRVKADETADRRYDVQERLDALGPEDKAQAKKLQRELAAIDRESAAVDKQRLGLAASEHKATGEPLRKEIADLKAQLKGIKDKKSQEALDIKGQIDEKTQRLKDVESEAKEIQTGRRRPLLMQSAKSDGELVNEFGRAKDIAKSVGENAERLLQRTLGNDYKAQLGGKFASELKGFMGEREQSFAGAIERFAEKFISKPSEAEALAPNLYHAFSEGLKNNANELYHVLQRAKEAARDQATQPATEQVRQKLVSGADGQEGHGVFRLFKKNTWEHIYTNCMDAIYPVFKKVQYASEKLGLEFDADQNAAKLMQMFAGVGGKVNHFLEYGTFDFNTMKKNGKGYKEIINGAQKDGIDLSDFSVYLAAKRGVELEGRGLKTGFGGGVAAKAVAELEAKYGDKLKTYAQEIHDFEHRVLDYFQKSGAISEETANLIKKMNQDYVPFHRVLMNTEEMSTAKGGKGIGRLKRVEGSSLDIYDPLETIVTNTYTMISAAEKNHVFRRLSDMAERMEGKEIGAGSSWCREVQLLPEDALTKSKVDEMVNSLGLGDVEAGAMKRAMSEAGANAVEELGRFWQATNGPRNDNSIIVWRDGKAHKYILDPEIARVCNDLNEQNIGVFLKLIGQKPAGWLRKGAVLSPEFLLRNPIRDAITTALTSKYGFVPGWDTMKGLYHVLKKDEVYQRFLRSGGAQSNFFSTDLADSVRTFNHLKDTGYTRKVWNVVTSPIETLMKISEISEEATRVGDFAKGLRADAQGEGRAQLESIGYNVRDNMDFARMGRDMRGINRAIAFFNPTLQGTDKMFRAAIANPKEFFVKAALYIATPSVLLALSNWGDEDVQNVPKAQRDIFWIVPMGEGASKVLLKIPKPFEAGVLFGSTLERTVEFCMDVMNDKNGGDVEQTMKDAYAGLGASLLDATTPNMIPTAMVPILENWANKSTYTGGPIVPAWMQNVVPEERSTEYTSQTSRMLARTIGYMPGVKDMFDYSPAKIDNLIRGWGGGLGTFVLGMLDDVYEAAGMVPDVSMPERDWTEIPGVKGFFVRYKDSLSKEPIRQFYDMAQRAKELQGTLKLMSGRGDTEGMQEYGFAAMLKPILDTQAVMNKITTSIRKTRNAPGLSPEEKRRMIEAMTLQAVHVAERGVQLGRELGRSIGRDI